MDNTIYATLARQSGLMAEMQVVANNIANASTNGFRREGVTFDEHIARLGRGDESLSMAAAEGRRIDPTQGELTQTGGVLDLAIQGDGYFQVQTANGPRLTRAGGFGTDAAGNLVTPDGFPVLDLGGAPVFVPPDVTDFSVGRDGTVSAGGQVLGQIGLVVPADPNRLERRGGNLFEAVGGSIPVENAQILQGFTEGSNVEPMREIARMMAVQHAYEAGQRFLENEDERIRSVISTLGS